MNWKGVFPAVTTKFHADGSLDMNLFFKNLDSQLAAGVHGIILGGTLGESSVLSQEEKITLTRETVNYVNGRVPVILNIAEGATQDALFWAKKAEELGASGLMILPPMRYGADAREVVAYFKAVANSTKLPMMIYNNPVDYKTLVTLDMFAELADCPNIQAIKESTRDISNVTRMFNRFGDRFQILCGVDTLALEELLMGAVGWVAGLVCAFPKETVDLQLGSGRKNRRSTQNLPLVFTAFGTGHSSKVGAVHQACRAALRNRLRACTRPSLDPNW
jgi:4-hydroxy-tetrahydrodipicolinate synthase